MWKSPINADKVLTTDQENQRPSRVLLMLASEKAFFSDANLTGNSPLGGPPVGPSLFPWLDAEARCPVPTEPLAVWVATQTKALRAD